MIGRASPAGLKMYKAPCQVAKNKTKNLYNPSTALSLLSSHRLVWISQLQTLAAYLQRYYSTEVLQEERDPKARIVRDSCSPLRIPWWRKNILQWSSYLRHCLGGQGGRHKRKQQLAKEEEKKAFQIPGLCQYLLLNTIPSPSTFSCHPPPPAS